MTTLLRPRAFVTYLPAACAAGLTTAAQHILLADANLSHEARYILGTATICAAFASWALQRGDEEAIAALLLITAGAGLPPVVGYALRRRQARRVAEGVRRA